MMIWALWIVPFVAGLAALAVRPDGVRRGLLLATAAAHAAMTASLWVTGAPASVPAASYLALDSLGLLFLSITSVLFLVAAFYTVGYLAREKAAAGSQREDMEEGMLFSNAREATFTGCLMLFLATMTLVTLSQHYGLLWVGVEATTLVSAPLIYFHRHHRSLEATWKYLLICSVGIALALLGSFFLAVWAGSNGQRDVIMTVTEMSSRAAGLGKGDSLVWLKAAFLLLLVGYGTKMGLAPMHTWLPDAHSEAPSSVSALLSGALLNCAFLAILRTHHLLAAAGAAEFSGGLLTGLGLLSMAIAAAFILRQADFKRMLAYSSVEHMGVLALGVGIGGLGTFGAMFHAVNHSLTKAMLFLLAGNILAAYKTKSTTAVTGVLRVLPATGVLWLAGFFAITGSPPFGAFVSELTILKAALAQGQFAVAAMYLLALTAVFVGMITIFLRMSQGAPAANLATARREPALAVWPPIVLAAATLVLGVYMPAPLKAALTAAANVVTGGH